MLAMSRISVRRALKANNIWRQQSYWLRRRRLSALPQRTSAEPMFASSNITRKPISRFRTTARGVVMSSAFRLSITSHVAAIAVGAVAATAYLTVYTASPQSLAAYVSAICAKSFGSASSAEAPCLAENVSAMTKMMIDMGIRPSGDVDTDFVAMMVPHHQGAIEMAQGELRYGRNEPLRRMAQEIIVTQLPEITAMRLSLGQALPPSVPSPDQIPPAAMNDSKSDHAALVKEP
jgi:hypothetical protein